MSVALSPEGGFAFFFVTVSILDQVGILFHDDDEKQKFD
jgi:hypothetical protein